MPRSSKQFVVNRVDVRGLGVPAIVNEVKPDRLRVGNYNLAPSIQFEVRNLPVDFVAVCHSSCAVAKLSLHAKGRSGAGNVLLARGPLLGRLLQLSPEASNVDTQAGVANNVCHFICKLVNYARLHWRVN